MKTCSTYYAGVAVLCNCNLSSLSEISFLPASVLYLYLYLLFRTNRIMEFTEDHEPELFAMRHMSRIDKKNENHYFWAILALSIAQSAQVGVMMVVVFFSSGLTGTSSHFPLPTLAGTSSHSAAIW